MNKAEYFEIEAGATEDKDTQELFASMLNEIKSTNNMFSTHSVLDNKYVAKILYETLGIEANDDLDVLKSLEDSVITPTATPPLPENANKIHILIKIIF